MDIILAAERGRLDIVRNLIESGANVNIHGALIQAAGYGHLEVVKELILNKANLNYQDWCGDTALIRAITYNRLNVAEELIRGGTDVNIWNITRDTALTLASWRGNLEIVKELLKAGSEVNHRNNRGETALFMAVWFGHLKVVKELLDRGVEVNIRNNAERIAFLLMCEPDRVQKPEIQRLLKSYLSAQLCQKIVLLNQIVSSDFGCRMGLNAQMEILEQLYPDLKSSEILDLYDLIKANGFRRVRIPEKYIRI